MIDPACEGQGSASDFEYRDALARTSPGLVGLLHPLLLGRAPDPEDQRQAVELIARHGSVDVLVRHLVEFGRDERRMARPMSYAEISAFRLAEACNAPPVARDYAVLGNCQATPLASILQALAGGPRAFSLFVTLAQVDDFLRGAIDLDGLFRTHRIVFVQTWLWQAVRERYAQYEAQVVLFPPVRFVAFHPDLAYILDTRRNAFVRGPCMDYNSAIALMAWKCGLDVGEAVALFRRDVFQRLGYFDWWDWSRNMAVAEGQACGMDLGARIDTWARQGCFMHSVNHPKLFALADVARVMLARAGIAMRPGHPERFVHDRLADSVVWPVYPEIAQHYGIEGGDYLFKLQAPGFIPDSPLELIGLEEFVARSYAAFDAHREEDLRCDILSFPQYQSLMDDLRAMKRLLADALPATPVAA